MLHGIKEIVQCNIFSYIERLLLSEHKILLIIAS